MVTIEDSSCSFGMSSHSLPSPSHLCHYQPMKRRLARATEITLRYSAIASLAPIVICNLYQPSLWLIMLVAGYVAVCLNNILCYQLAAHTLESARGVLSTVPLSDDPGLRAFAT